MVRYPRSIPPLPDVPIRTGAGTGRGHWHTPVNSTAPLPARNRVDYPYLPLIDFHSRSDISRAGLHDIKSKATQPYEYISVETQDTLTKIVSVSLHLSGHDPKSEVDKLSSGRSLSAVHIRNTYNNTALSKNLLIVKLSILSPNLFDSVASNKNHENKQFSRKERISPANPRLQCIND